MNRNVFLRLLFLAMALAFTGLYGGAGEALAANLYYDGGEVPLPGAEDVVWIYNGRSGQFVSEEEATFSLKKGTAISLKSDGSFKAKKEGQATISVKEAGAKGQGVNYIIHVVNYPKNFSISPKRRTTTGPSQDDKYPMQTSFQIKGVSAGATAPVEFSVEEGGMEPYISRNNRQVRLLTSVPGDCTVVVNYAGVVKKFRWSMKGIGVKDGTMLMAPNDSEKIPMQNAAPQKFKWTSSNKAVAAVSQDGRVTAKKIGNAVITGVSKAKGFRVGCVVSVTTQPKINAIDRGKKIAEGTYSLTRRMQQGFYDCSSLVWRAYVPEGINFGVPYGGYAPVAGAECQFLERQGKIVSTWKEKDMTKLNYLAGDLMFRTNTGNGHYRGINHVEMIAGYDVHYDTRKKAVVRCLWVNRDPDYSYTINSWDMIGRP